MKMNLKKGFTLIELLVVVAIIGILASVVLASLNTARSKGSDAAIKSNLDNMRAQAALYYDGTVGNQTYGTAGSTCTAAGSMYVDPTIAAAITQVSAQSGAVSCANTTTTYVMAAVLKSTGTGATKSDGSAAQAGGYGIYCVDSNGIGKVNATATTLAGAISGGLCS
jgi:prepilin-type N-terminal cleavage/methylation domain-containing protein